MSYLLDTHILIWAAKYTDRLKPETLQSMMAPDTQLWFSVASIWEMTIKKSRHTDFEVDPTDLRQWFFEQGMSEVTITANHALAVQHLPKIHGDPFDRMLIAQATIENLTLLTADKTVAAYPGPVRLAV